MPLLRLFLITLFVLSTSIASAKLCLVEDEALEKLLSNPNKSFQVVCPDQPKQTDIHGAISLIEKYWNRTTTNVISYSLLSEKYKRDLVEFNGITTPDKYRIPGFYIERHVRDHWYNYIRIGGPNFVQISLQVSWTEEGYEGDMTYIFDLTRENSEWRIANIMK